MDPELKNVLYVVAAALALGALALGYVGAQPIYYQALDVRTPGLRETRWTTVARPTPKDWNGWVADLTKKLPSQAASCSTSVECSVYGSCVGEANCTVTEGGSVVQYARLRIERGPVYGLALLGYGSTPQ